MHLHPASPGPIGPRSPGVWASEQQSREALAEADRRQEEAVRRLSEELEGQRSGGQALEERLEGLEAERQALEAKVQSLAEENDALRTGGRGPVVGHTSHACYPARAREPAFMDAE